MQIYSQKKLKKTLRGIDSPLEYYYNFVQKKTIRIQPSAKFQNDERRKMRDEKRGTVPGDGIGIGDGCSSQYSRLAVGTGSPVFRELCRTGRTRRTAAHYML